MVTIPITMFIFIELKKSKWGLGSLIPFFEQTFHTNRRRHSKYESRYIKLQHIKKLAVCYDVAPNSINKRLFILWSLHYKEIELDIMMIFRMKDGPSYLYFG